MSRRILILGLVSLITVGTFILAVFFSPPSGLPFAVKPQGASGQVIVPSPGIPLPAGLQSQDQLELKRMTPAARVAVVFGSRLNIRPGLSFEIVVRRGHQILTVPVTSRPVPQTQAQRLADSFTDAALLGFLGLGLLALWRGRSLEAWGLGLFSVMVAFSSTAPELPVTALQGLGLNIFVLCIGMPLMLLGLYLMARGLAGESLVRTARKWYALAFSATMVLYVATVLTQIGAAVLGRHTWPAGMQIGLSTLPSLVTAVLFASGYRRADPEKRLRMRWILYATALLPVGIVIQALEQLSGNRMQTSVIQFLADLVFLLVVVGYTYAVLRNRLVSVRLAVNRTLVYGAITVVVVGVFAAVNSVVEHATLDHGASLLLELIVPLALGIVLGSLRKYVDTYINRFLFRRQYRAEKALNDFARTCGFIEQPEHLLDLTVQQVFEHSRAQGVALYERDAKGYSRVRQRGTAEFVERVAADDLAFVRLRAGDREAELHEVASALGKDGYVFPMAVRGKLIGALVCGSRPAEQYTADERELLYHVAQQAGAALHALRNREHERFVDSIASGALDADSARARARELAAAWQMA
ncbi:MAG: GAF domain-containing protein [Gammaproteobacteria bacterium]